MASHDIITFSHAPGQDQHAYYFSYLENALRLVLDVFTCASQNRKQTFEAVALQRFCRRLLNTIEIMRLKYAYNPSEKLSIDVCDSGFPSFLNFDSVMMDLRSRETRLAKLPNAEKLKKEILDRLMRDRTDPGDLLWRLSERSYLEILDPNEIFLPFTPGKLQKNFENDKVRNYSIAWNCFDEATNCPVMYLMNFDQDISETPLETEDVNFHSLIETIGRQSTGNRNLLYVAAGIDETLNQIHPKHLKRIKIGPVCINGYSKEPKDLQQLITDHGEENETIVCFDDEIIISVEQKRSGKFWSLGKVNEVFLVPETDLECYTSGVSKVHHYLIVPHRIHQILDLNGVHSVYKKHTIIPYIMRDGKGEIYAENCTELLAD